MNGNAELLNYIYQNSQMGVGTIRHLLGIIQDTEFKRQLQAQYDGYKESNDEAKRLLMKTIATKRASAHSINLERIS